MEISKYVDFILKTAHSNKKNTDYYCICIKVDDKEFPIAFMNKDSYDLLISKLK